MKYQYCIRCKQLYMSGNMGICSSCLHEIDKIVAEIRNYLEENPKANISEICNETGISEKDILYLLREERLMLNEESPLLSCQSCGTSITTGKYCDKCRTRLEASLNQASKQIRGLNTNTKPNVPSDRQDNRERMNEKSKPMDTQFRGGFMNVLERRNKE